MVAAPFFEGALVAGAAEQSGGGEDDQLFHPVGLKAGVAEWLTIGTAVDAGQHGDHRIHRNSGTALHHCVAEVRNCSAGRPEEQIGDTGVAAKQIGPQLIFGQGQLGEDLDPPGCPIGVVSKQGDKWIQDCFNDIANRWRPFPVRPVRRAR